MSQRRWTKYAGIGGALLFATAATVEAQSCPTPPPNPPFTEPPVIEAKCGGQPCKPGQAGAIDTEFRIETRSMCVPGSTTPATLRTYVFPDPKNPKNWTYGFPGPTLKLRKPSNPGGKGDSLAILLVNNLASDSNQCDSACPATVVCPDRKDLPDPATQCGTNPLCCCWVNANQHPPDCFHGDNTTNLHFHGTHVSPQSPQDYVLLELHPKGDQGKKLQAMTARSDLEVGSFHYKVDPLTYEQAEGSHWYHPHKHGSVSLQVANGMPGALIILGPFDDWLAKWYADRGVKLAEKVMVAQQIEQDTNLFGKGGAPQVLINGLLNPTLTVQAGEVQRWRIVNATMQKANQVTVTFPTGSEVMQIAMDGVQFAPANYDKQPLLKDKKFILSPGNRADFLVRMPLAAGKAHLTEEVFGELSQRAREQIERRDRATKLLAGEAEEEAPAVLTLNVVEPPKGKANLKAVPPGFPTAAEWPKMPWYLEDIDPNKVKGHHDLTFSMVALTNSPPAPGGAGNPATVFLINDRQYCPNCVDVTTELNTSDEWHIENSSPLPHPFHIHTNPFQLVEEGAMINGQRVAKVKYVPPVWQDTVALPTPTSQDVDAGPIWNNNDAKLKCPGVCAKTKGVWNGNWKTTVPGQMSVCGCNYNGYVQLLHRYLDFTGEYVLHCHFLGHEDRGMMFGVQTVCENKPDSFGKARTDGKPECVEGNYTPATQKCPQGTAECPMSH
ncbi:MAG TPA: multicopper oxidase domain-containing protein [Thermoanaerobaculia bacterium]|jgi:FtsP/CotA-like multicopper oxidase with cupredoxin domain|nr:multicopper oxidase domain-containing protein [Thermoanaerobaculia bacterium]